MILSSEGHPEAQAMMYLGLGCCGLLVVFSFAEQVTTRKINKNTVMLEATMQCFFLVFCFVSSEMPGFGQFVSLLKRVWGYVL